MGNSTDYADILYGVDAGVATITLNRPDRLNAWCASLDTDVRAAMRAASDDDAVRVIVLTGAGRGFCAGADMNVLQGIQDGGGDARPEAAGPWDPAAREDFRKQYSWFPAVPKPIIAAINGPCAGLGMVLALYADIRLASDLAVFSTAFARRGLIAEHGISWLLPRLVGMANAADLLFSARRVEAAEARGLGLVNRVIPHADFAAEVQAYARMLASEVSPRSLVAMKRELWNAQFTGLGEAIEAANLDMVGSFASDDFREGVAHYLEKRPAAFTGR
ncbi:enoyl-CoA hydratase [Sandarakinorhabdus sp. DWP1-3-1]|uniref:enoyl-CoA hydratase n=1 Tax=Sandarakinorhabdus sp. DWP1-3-1 TaxID=2804627 RepID=UPI003CF7C3F3